MTPLRQPMLAALHLRGKGERTQQADVRAVRRLAPFSHPAPDRLSAQDLQPYFLPRQNVDRLAPASMRLCSSGIRVFSQHVLPRDWHTRTRLRAPTAHRLPAVLRVEEVRRLLMAATPWHNPVSFTTVSRLGLRLPAARSLQGADRDGQRLQVQSPRGKGATDRAVPLPNAPRALRRTSWKTPRHTLWLFPATGRDPPPSPLATSPRRRPRVQGAFRTATPRAGLTTRGGASQTLSPASAPPRRDAGVPPRLLQRSLGPTPRDTPLVS
jgi:integrase/recombinase XerD